MSSLTFEISLGKEASTIRTKPSRPPVTNIVDLQDDQPAHDSDRIVALIPTITYYPVDMEWQERICDAFGWTFHQQSSPVTEPTEIYVTRQPKITRVVGDGNCYYRAIAYIVTGRQEEWQSIKVSVLSLMLLNRDLITAMVISAPDWLDIPLNQNRRDFLQLTPQQKVTRYLQYHWSVNAWADTQIIYFTGFLLNTRVEIFKPGQVGRWIVDHASWSGLQREAVIFTVQVPETNDQALYICNSTDHFDAACMGLLN